MTGRSPDGEPQVSPARAEDLAGIRTLLSSCGLSADDLPEALDTFLVARTGDRLVGTIGLDIHGPAAVLRSLAVAPDYRARGLATSMCKAMFHLARHWGVIHLYTLTTSAEAFAARLGFARFERDDAPPQIRRTHPFSSSCPGTATCLWRRLPDGAIHLPRELLRVRPDVPGAWFWAVGLERAMLTFFEVAPGTRFDTHAHSGEQITAVIEGELSFTVDGEVHCVRAGGVIALPAGVRHAVVAGEQGAKAFDAWSPPVLDRRDRGG
jgi:amino-acid N-acetyltransferase